MREIKFRAWCKKNKRMFLPVAGCDLLVRIDGKLFTDIDIVENVGLYDTNMDEFIIMQYTGLKDKNGKMIYESDIVKVKLDIVGDKKYLCEVIWNDGGFDFLGINKACKVCASKYYSEDCEIIGNIYENKERLDKTKK